MVLLVHVVWLRIKPEFFFPFWVVVLLVLWSCGPPQNGGGDSGIQLTIKGISVVKLVCLIPFQLNQLSKFFLQKILYIESLVYWSVLK